MRMIHHLQKLPSVYLLANAHRAGTTVSSSRPVRVALHRSALAAFLALCLLLPPALASRGNRVEATD